MNGISAYTNDPTRPNAHPAVAAITTQPSAPSTPNAPAPTRAPDKVSLSPEVRAAQTRESLGLPPTGSLKLKDFQETAKTQATTVDKTIAQRATALGIDPNQAMTLTLDTKGRIQIQEKFAGKDELAKTLNQDKAFLNEFEKCRACNGILDLTRGLPLAQTATTNLLTQDTDWEDILSLAKRQKLIKNSTDDLATLVTIGQKELSYKHAYSPQ